MSVPVAKILPLPFAVFKVDKVKDGLGKSEVIGRLSTENDAVFLAKNIFKALQDTVESVRVWDTQTMREIVNFI